MSNFKIMMVGSIAALRSTASVCLTLLTTSIASRLSVLIYGRLLAGEPGSKSQLAIGSSRFLVGFVLLGQEIDSLPIGAHLISPRSFYMHHGIYLGHGDVAHYSGFSASLKAGPVEVTNLEGFAHGKPVWIFQERGEFSNEEIASRARSRVGESQYRLLSNNCEHFCSWCISGKSCSAQINAYLHCPGHLLSLISALDPRFVA